MHNKKKIKFNAYLSVEASLLFPIIIVLLYIIVGVTFTIFNRCYQNQSKIVNDFKTQRYVDAGNERNEVVFNKITGEEIINPLKRIKGERY